MRNVLKAWVILQKKMRPFVYLPIRGTLSQEHGFAQVTIKIAIKSMSLSKVCCPSHATRGMPCPAMGRDIF